MTIDGFEERFRYLSVRGKVGEETFGFERWLNQTFYTSREWRQLRLSVIARDMGCDLGVRGRDIHDCLIVHHMNPLVQDDIIHGTENALNPEYLISTSRRTHNAIHFGDETLLRRDHIPRKPGDTKLW
jgi:hypothetical protein